MLAIYRQELPVCTAASSWIGVLTRRALLVLAVFLINVTSPLVPQLLPVSVMLKAFKMRQLKNWIIVLYSRNDIFLVCVTVRPCKKELVPVGHVEIPGGLSGERSAGAAADAVSRVWGWHEASPLQKCCYFWKHLIWGSASFHSLCKPLSLQRGRESSPKLAYLHGFAMWIARVVKLSAQVVTGYLNP